MSVTRRSIRRRPAVVATHNAGKLERRSGRCWSPFGVALTSAGEHGLTEPGGDRGHIRTGNARIQAHAAARAHGLPALADDSRDTIDACRRPGVGRGIGSKQGVWTGFCSGNDADLERAEACGCAGARAARKFVCHAGAWPGPTGMTRCSRAVMPGRIALADAGGSGHGYESTFPAGTGMKMTFCEMDRWEEEPRQPPRPGTLPRWSRAVLADRLAGRGLRPLWCTGPFCQAKSPYCDFNSHVVAGGDQARWGRALGAEIRLLGVRRPGPKGAGSRVLRGGDARA